MSDNIEDLDAVSFDKTTGSSDKLVIVEFFNNSCPSCQAIAPVYSALSKELAEHAVFTRVNAQQNMEIAMRFGIMATPTFKFFCKGRPIGELYRMHLEIDEARLRDRRLCLIERETQEDSD
jgi:thiol-disulfide isomerase/thioredoxin